MNPSEQTAAWRTIDANFNRAVEGLRVVEDHARFGLNDPFLAKCCKELRHDLTSALAALDARQERLIARDTLADVGTSITTPQETQRESLSQLVAANWQRVAQALRVIEEFGKLLGSQATVFESLRYRIYTLAKAFVLNERSQSTWQDRQLYALIDGGSNVAEFSALARQLIEAGVMVIQLRDKELNDRDLLDRARRLRAVIDETPTAQAKPLFIVNDRPDIALLARADGVHVGQDELSVSDVRRLVGTQLQIGVSTHSIEQARAAVLAGADYLGCGPTFESATKAFAVYPGLPFLRQVAEEISLPAFAIGGITLELLPRVLEAGMQRVAVSSAIAKAPAPGDAAAQFLRQFAAVKRTG